MNNKIITAKRLILYSLYVISYILVINEDINFERINGFDVKIISTSTVCIKSYFDA